MKTLLTGKPYTNAAETDIRKTFKRIRAELKEQAQAQLAKVTQLPIKERK